LLTMTSFLSSTVRPRGSLGPSRRILISISATRVCRNVRPLGGLCTGPRTTAKAISSQQTLTNQCRRTLVS
jgi:hypothetical protein